jgi:hypothetical protein
MNKAEKENSGIEQMWQEKKAELKVRSNAFLEYPEEELWEKWEKLCKVPPLRFALVNVNLPYDLAQFAQVILSTTNRVPHIATYLIGETLDFMQPKVRNKIMSWNIGEENIKWLPRKTISLLELKNDGYRLIGTSPNQGENALEYQWGPRDICVIGGAKGLSRANIGLLDGLVKIPCSQEVPFLTTPTVIPILSYPALKARGLWH